MNMAKEPTKPMNEASSAVINHFRSLLGGFTFSREEAEYLKELIDGAVHDGWTRPGNLDLLPPLMR